MLFNIDIDFAMEREKILIINKTTKIITSQHE